ncbi:MAG: hypothetical protein EXR21_09970 [Flavobacteriaceae bacterium]|nr:hypothetical protein [Flavobacteriaceae bacterium]
MRENIVRYRILKDQIGEDHNDEPTIVLKDGDIISGHLDNGFIHISNEKGDVSVPESDTEIFVEGSTYIPKRGDSEFVKQTKYMLDKTIATTNPKVLVAAIMIGWGVVGYATHSQWHKGGMLLKATLVGLALANTYLTYRMVREIEKCRKGRPKAITK